MAIRPCPCQALASAGELLVSVAAAEHAGLEVTSLDRRTIGVRGRQAGLDVYSIASGSGPRLPAR